MIRKTKEPEKTISGLIKTVFDWDNLDLIEEARELLSNIYEPPVQKTPRWVGELRVNKFSEIVHPPIEPEKPDTSNWKRITPKRQGILAQYRVDKAQYDIDMAEWLQLPLLDDGRTVLEHRLEFLRNKPSIDYGINKESYYAYLNGTFEYEIPTFAYPCGKWDKRLGTNLRVEMPEWAVEHHKMEIVYHEDPTDLGMWLDDLIDPVWRREEYERERTEYRQSRSKFRKARDTTVQLDLFSNNYRDITKDVLHTFETDPNKELAMKYVLALVDKYRPYIYGTVNIPSIYILLNASERDEIDRRAEMVRG